MVDKAAFESIPKDLRGLRACLVCSLVKVRKGIFFFGLNFEKYFKLNCIAIIINN